MSESNIEETAERLDKKFWRSAQQI